jgi:hypothetical protein
MDRPTNRWQAQVQPLARLTFSECGVRFHGHESVVTALRTEKGIPRAERDLADVAKLAALLNGACLASTQSAPAMFIQAVRLTTTLGASFAIPQGAVSLPIDIVIIPREGSIEVSRVASW